jgi:hypothetical protein
MQPLQNEKTVCGVEALGKSWVRTQAAVNLYLLLESRTTRRVDFHHYRWVVGVREYCGIVPHSDQLPRWGKVVDDHRVVGIDALQVKFGE